MFGLGINYIKKQAKNQVTWLKAEIYQSEKECEKNKQIPQESPFKKELMEKQREDQKLQKLITSIQHQIDEIKSNPDFSNHNFLTYSDIKKMTNQEGDKTVVAVKVPEDGKVEYLKEEIRKKILEDTKSKMKEGTNENYDDICECLSKKHQVYVSSENGQINVYLIMNNDDKGKQQETNTRVYDPLCSGSQDNGENSIHGRAVLSSDSKNNYLKGNLFEFSESLLI